MPTLPSPSVALAYRPEGFRQIGGIRRLALEVVGVLKSRTEAGGQARLATLVVVAAHGDGYSHGSLQGGVLPGTVSIQKIQPRDHLLIFGCDSVWAYLLVLWLRLARRSISVWWLPSFHDPAHARHRWRALLAQRMLQVVQWLGVVVYVQTSHEQRLLAGPRCRLSSHALAPQIRTRLQLQLPTSPRSIDLLFLGRPTDQKGWSRFLELVKATGLCAVAIVPVRPCPEPSIPGLRLEVAPSDAEISRLLEDAKLVTIPADYESFGLAQLEAVASGCVVPILGCWPLWEGFPWLNWQRCSVTQLKRHCYRLSSSESLRRRLAQRQRHYLQGHSLMQTPWLPGL